MPSSRTDGEKTRSYCSGEALNIEEKLPQTTLDFKFVKGTVEADDVPYLLG